jgi:tetraprenyl-beta-curcumene synthase
VLSRISRRLALTVAFSSAARRYWLGVFPAVRREIRCLRRYALRIPGTELRSQAIHNLKAEDGNLEGAVAFAAFIPNPYRDYAIRAQVAFQATYDYVDSLAEQPRGASPQNAGRLHCALLVALSPGAPHLDYYAHHPSRADQGYLVELVDSCRAAISCLPSYPLVAETVQGAAQRILTYQHYNQPASDQRAFADWAGKETPSGAELRWWETGAACGSSLTIFALLAAAADPQLKRHKAEAVEAIYWPWAGALHTLLDSLIDRDEDAENGLHSLISHYACPQEMATRLQLLANEALKRAKAVGIEHRLILAGMASLYLSDERAWLPEACLSAERVLGALGDLAAPAMLVLRVRRRFSARSSSRPSGSRTGRVPNRAGVFM